jgi:hypothetical protein
MDPVLSSSSREAHREHCSPASSAPTPARPCPALPCSSSLPAPPPGDHRCPLPAPAPPPATLYTAATAAVLRRGWPSPLPLLALPPPSLLLAPPPPIPLLAAPAHRTCSPHLLAVERHRTSLLAASPRPMAERRRTSMLATSPQLVAERRRRSSLHAALNRRNRRRTAAHGLASWGTLLRWCPCSPEVRGSLTTTCWVSQSSRHGLERLTLAAIAHRSNGDLAVVSSPTVVCGAIARRMSRWGWRTVVSSDREGGRGRRSSSAARARRRGCRP